jgi:mannan endo-1,4-beta-mannosidase
MVPKWASSNSTVVSSTELVDQWTGFIATMSVDTADGVQPNDSGSQKLADKWYTAHVSRFWSE